jgi:branched-chain amino acid transport system permease protein
MGIGYPALRIRGPYFCVLTFVMVPAVRTVFFNLVKFTGGAEGIYVKSPYSTGTYYLIFLSLAVLATIMAILIERSKFGIGLTSIREDEDAAEVMGVNTTRMKVMAFGLSALFPGIVGGIYPFYKLYINPAIAFTEEMAIMIVLFCFFGGKRWWLGPIIGASILTAVSRVLHIHAGGIIGLLRLETMFPHISSGILAGFIYGLVLILVIIFMPGGILSQLDKWLVKKS